MEENTEIIEDGYPEPQPENDPPYREIERTIMSAKRAPRKSYAGTFSFFASVTASAIFIGLAIHGGVSLLSSSAQSQSQGERISVRFEDSFKRETYGELVVSEADSVDFGNPLMLDSLTLTDGVISATARADQTLADMDSLVLYQPGGNLFYPPANMTFPVGGSADLKTMELESGADYLLCYGNAFSAKLRVVTFPGGTGVQGETYSTVIDPDLLNIAIVRVA